MDAIKLRKISESKMDKIDVKKDIDYILKVCHNRAKDGGRTIIIPFSELSKDFVPVTDYYVVVFKKLRKLGFLATNGHSNGVSYIRVAW